MFSKNVSGCAKQRNPHPISRAKDKAFQLFQLECKESKPVAGQLLN